MIASSAPTSTPPTVIIIDDDPSVRATLDSLFRSVGLNTQTFASARDFLAEPSSGGVRCLVVDVRLPKMSGLDLQKELITRGDEASIIMMTGHGDIPMTVRAMKAGAIDFLTKPFRDQEMIDAVTGALARDEERRRAKTSSETTHARFGSLTPRERQVMALVVSGLMNKQVAGELGLSEITVKLHRASVMKKMGARSLPDLVRMADTIDQDEVQKVQG